MVHSLVSSDFASLSLPLTLAFLSITNRDSQEKFSDTEYMTSPPLSKMFPCPAVDTSSQKLCQDETELFSDSSITKPLNKEVEAAVESPIHKISVQELETSVDVSSRKEERDTKGDLIDSASRNVYKDIIDLPLEVKKILWNELEATSDLAPRKISGDMMGASMDNASRKMIREDVERSLESVSRRITRDSMGMSLDRLTWNKGECQLESSVRALAIDKVVEASKTPPRKISRDELEFCTDTASLRMLPSDKFEALKDTSSSKEKQELNLEPSTSRRTLRGELETSVGSIRRRILRMPRQDIDSSTDTLTGKILWDRVDAPMEIPKQSGLRDELEASDSSSVSGGTGQPDVTETSVGSWKSSSELFSVSPLSQVVYDGILEKSCSPMASTPNSLSASTPNLPQSSLLAEVEPPLPPPRIASPPCATPSEKLKTKEKSKTSMKLKNLFKKKNESTPENLQSGLQKL